MSAVRISLIVTLLTTAGTLACAPPAGPSGAGDRTVPAVADAPTKAPTASRNEPRRADLPRATTPSGSELSLELALTPEEITQGLMFRPSLPDDRGMLFVFPQPRFPSFWMFNTWIPLDMVFLDENGVVVDVERDTRPCPSEPCPKYVPREPAMAVLEINAGLAATCGLDVGARVEFANIPGYPLPQAE